MDGWNAKHYLRCTNKACFFFLFYHELDTIPKKENSKPKQTYTQDINGEHYGTCCYHPVPF